MDWLTIRHATTYWYPWPAEDTAPEDCSIVVHGKRNKQRTVYLAGNGLGLPFIEGWAK